jgi:glycine hydroxymethyltransferase
LEHIIASKAVAFKECLAPEFKSYQLQVVKNAKALAASLSHRGFKLVSGGTDNHLVLLDLSKTEVSGKELEIALESVAITANKNTVPNETRSPFVTSGIRLGTPALTTRGFKEPQMEIIAGWIFDTFQHIKEPTQLQNIREQVIGLAKQFPLYPDWT